MNCTICNKPIVLIPSAKERADKCGGKPADYTRLFTSHSNCFIAKRSADTSALMRKELAAQPSRERLQQSAALQLADACAGDWEAVRPHLVVQMLRDQHARIADLEALQAAPPAPAELEQYDAGLLNDFGGGNVEWWQDYIRAELARAYDFYQSQCEAPAAVAVPEGLEPVECQWRMRPDWDNKHPWTDWAKCSPESAARYERTPILHNWIYEVRRFYSAAQVQAMGRVPVDLEAVWDAFTEAVRVKVGAKELVNIIGSVKALRSIFLAAASRPPAEQEDAA